jgi:hypothetical protein
VPADSQFDSRCLCCDHRVRAYPGSSRHPPRRVTGNSGRAVPETGILLELLSSPKPPKPRPSNRRDGHPCPQCHSHARRFNRGESRIEPWNRGTRSGISRRDTITEYSEWELIALIDRIESDGRLRTDEEMIDELLPELGFHRRGARIEGVLKSALEKHRNRLRTAK